VGYRPIKRGCILLGICKNPQLPGSGDALHTARAVCSAPRRQRAPVPPCNTPPTAYHTLPSARALYRVDQLVARHGQVKVNLEARARTEGVCRAHVGLRTFARWAGRHAFGTSVYWSRYRQSRPAERALSGVQHVRTNVKGARGPRSPSSRRGRRSPGVYRWRVEGDSLTNVHRHLGARLQNASDAEWCYGVSGRALWLRRLFCISVTPRPVPVSSRCVLIRRRLPWEAALRALPFTTWRVLPACGRSRAAGIRAADAP